LAATAGIAGCGGDDSGSGDRTERFQQSELKQPQDSGKERRRACALLSPGQVARLAKRPAASLDPAPNDSTDLSICDWRGAGVRIELVLDTAPRAQLRFYNLTWLTDNVRHVQLDQLPEALAAGHDALGPDTDEDPVIRSWMAANTRDLTRIPPSLDNWAPFDRAIAYEVIGDTARAVDAAVDSMRTGYNHRAARLVLERMHAAGLTRASLGLAETVLDASDRDFLALWETAAVVQGLRPDGGSATGEEPADDVERLADRFRARLVDLSRFDFMNALRLHKLFGETGYDDLAEELLLGAAQQAESVSELLAVAVLHRMSPIRSVYADQEGLRCLARAHRLAGERQERLEIAREYLAFGLLRAGRALLVQERVLDEDTVLSPREVVVALQCARGCTPAERAALVGRAVRRLNEDVAAGRLEPYPATYGRRLVETLHAVVPEQAAELSLMLDPRLTESMWEVPWQGEQAGSWATVRTSLRALVTADDEPGDTWIAELPRTGSFGLQLLVIGHLRNELDRAEAAARQAAPDLPAQQIPVAKAVDNGDGPRTIELCLLWRARLTGDGRNTDELRQFFATEQELGERWEAERAEAGAGHLRRVVRVGRMLEVALSALGAAHPGAEPHPVLGPVLAAVEQDVRDLLASTRERVRIARDLLPAADPAADGEGGP